ncbi:hypothetical protein A0256_04690 [Mucilaginibacter sp. PAMC 26640]|nr:hypothetical protein A0256_04690 [Mucilaginibacter sp. PAMC 26640]
MKSKFTILITMALAILISSCSKNDFNERDAVEAQKELLNLKYQHEIDLETLKQKGASALQQMVNTAALNQLRISDSLTRASAVAANKQDYSVSVVDVVTNAPIVDADVTVSSEGKVFAAKTNAQGIAAFTSLYLFPTSAFLVSKTGYAATQLFRKDITLTSAKLWNTADLSNEISGTLYIETDLTNNLPEKAGANVLVSATSRIDNGFNSFYSVSFPTYSTAGGAYSLKLPAAPNGYSLTFDQIAADQKLFINASEDDAVKTFPSALPSLATIKTYFNVNTFNAPVPTVYTATYLKVSKDKNGKNLYIPISNSNYYYYYYNQIFLTGTDGHFQVDRLYTSSYNNNNGVYFDFNAYNYDPNTSLNVEIVDITGAIVQTAPILTAKTDQNGKLMSYNSPEGGSGYVHLTRDASGNLAANARGAILKASLYDSYSGQYILGFNAALNTTSNTYVNTTYLLPNKGDKKVVNFYYGSGDTRVKQVY